jgi:hypothetical protein
MHDVYLDHQTREMIDEYAAAFQEIGPSWSRIG